MGIERQGKPRQGIGQAKNPASKLDHLLPCLNNLF